jgi:hypothetical protein
MIPADGPFHPKPRIKTNIMMPGKSTKSPGQLALQQQRRRVLHRRPLLRNLPVKLRRLLRHPILPYTTISRAKKKFGLHPAKGKPSQATTSP